MQEIDTFEKEMFFTTFKEIIFDIATKIKNKIIIIDPNNVLNLFNKIANEFYILGNHSRWYKNHPDKNKINYHVKTTLLTIAKNAYIDCKYTIEKNTNINDNNKNYSEEDMNVINNLINENEENMDIEDEQSNANINQSSNQNISFNQNLNIYEFEENLNRRKKLYYLSLYDDISICKNKLNNLKNLIYKINDVVIVKKRNINNTFYYIIFVSFKERIYYNEYYFGVNVIKSKETNLNIIKEQLIKNAEIIYDFKNNETMQI